MDFYGFIQWCFRDGGSTIITLFVLVILLNGLANILRAIFGTHYCPCDDDDDDDDLSSEE